jgi:hypothetical protein
MEYMTAKAQPTPKPKPRKNPMAVHVKFTAVHPMLYATWLPMECAIA